MSQLIFRNRRSPSSLALTPPMPGPLVHQREEGGIDRAPSCSIHATPPSLDLSHTKDVWMLRRWLGCNHRPKPVWDSVTDAIA